MKGVSTCRRADVTTCRCGMQVRGCGRIDVRTCEMQVCPPDGGFMCENVQVRD